MTSDSYNIHQMIGIMQRLGVRAPIILFGIIGVNGRENRELTRKSLRKSYAMVLQDTWVFEGTIFENIAYGKENATMEEVMKFKSRKQCANS